MFAVPEKKLLSKINGAKISYLSIQKTYFRFSGEVKHE